VNVVPQAAHGFAEDPPERSGPLAVGDAEVDGVWERPTPVDPVIGRYGVVASLLYGQRLHPDSVSIRVDAAVLDHQIHADQVALQSRPPRWDVTLVHLQPQLN